METVARNAKQSLARHKVARAGDLTTRSQALQQLQDALELDEAPLRIECFDISHVQGTQVVGSMVVFEDGLPRKSEYRRFIVRGDETGATDDTAAMHEVLTRRFRRWPARGGRARPSGMPRPRSADGPTPEVGARPARFAYRPNLVVVDGGLPQVNAAARALEDFGVVDVAVVGLAKRLEEVWVPGEEYPVVLPRTSEGLYLLQRLRDEAHRFAITFHRQRRSKAMTTSQLDGIPGLGEKRRKALLKQFGSVKRIRAASVDELAAVPGIGPALAAVVAAELGSRRRRMPAVNLATGEVRRRRRSGPCRWIGQWLTTSPRGGGLPPVPRSTDFVIVTGMSGAGRSTAANVIEDRGWYVVDNLPPQLLSPMAELAGRCATPGSATCASPPSSTCGRAPSTPSCRPALAALRDAGWHPHLIFLDATDEALVRRFESVRRPHPLQGDGRLLDGIQAEREMLRDLRAEAAGRHRHLRAQRPPARPQARRRCSVARAARACGWR